MMTERCAHGWRGGRPVGHPSDCSALLHADVYFW